jgi:hypothetical protein
MTEKKQISGAAKLMSQSGAAKGGRARASTLTPEQRSEAARRAVTARWERAGKVPPKDPPKKMVKTAPDDEDVPYSMYPGTLPLGKLRLRCHVLNDGRRVLTQSEVMRVLRGKDTRTTSLSNYLAGLEGFDPKKLPAPITFRIPGLPRTALGYEATLLIDICDAYVEAWNGGRLFEHQIRIAVTAEIIIRACAKVGIIALIDEATGYQQVRAKNALELKLKAFIADDMRSGRACSPRSSGTNSLVWRASTTQRSTGRCAGGST